MAKRGTIIVFSGALGVYTGALSTVVAELLGWRWARFSDFIRVEAKLRGGDPRDRSVLQRVGQELVREQCEHFVASVLAMATWRSGEDLILDGLRHAEVLDELRTQIGTNNDVRVVHIAIDDRNRRADRAKRADGLGDTDFDLYDRDVTEAQVASRPAYAEFIVDGSRPRGELARAILKRFVPQYQPSILVDDKESVSRMEPLQISRPELINLASELSRQSADFAAEVPIGLRQPLGDLVRAMNCYYSNLIEGHDMPPEDIELALGANYASDSRRRHLQAEARAHIAVQEWIDGGGLEGQPAVSTDALRKIHDRFCSEFPEALWVENLTSKERICVIPGHYRRKHARVGRHVAPSPGAVPRFLARFESVYGDIRNASDVLLAAAAAHHRLLWIHPFEDGNGRVARLMSDAMLSDVLHTHNIWSVSRGLARSHDAYKKQLAECDLGRRNDLDGRGNLSEEALVNFTRFFLVTCLDQIQFMRDRMRLDNLRSRLEEWVLDAYAFGRLPQSASQLLDAVLNVGALSQGEAQEILGDETHADSALRYLIAEGILRARGDAVTFSLPAKLARRFFPGLFP